jgi:SH3 domain-containing YSC84-like protein 1
MTRGTIATLFAGFLLLSPFFSAHSAARPPAPVGQKEENRMREAGVVLEEILGAPDKGIPNDLLRDCAGIVIIPGVKKGAFIVGGEYGRGLMIVRQENRRWGSPGFISLSGGSFGFQIGGQSTDIILLVMNKKGIEKLASSKFKLGADASVAGGPVGRTAKANTDGKFKAQILAYSRSQGVFAGVSLEGAVLKVDDDANKSVYGRKVTHFEVLDGNLPRPAAAGNLYALLRKYAV